MSDLQKHLRRHQVSLLVVLFLLVGAYFTFQDVKSIGSSRQNSLEQAALSLAYLVTNPSFAGAATTKNSKTAHDSQLKELLTRLKADFEISGHLSVLDGDLKLVGSSNEQLRKGELFAGLESGLIPAVLEQNLVRHSGFHWSESQLRSVTYAPIRSLDGKALAVLALQSNDTGLVFQILSYLTHYLLLGAILLLLVFLFSFRRKYSKPQDLLQETSDGVFMLNLKGQIESANETAQKIFGLSKKQLVGKFLTRPNPRGFSFISLDAENAIAAKTLEQGLSFRGKAKLVLENGALRYLSFSCSPFFQGSSFLGAIVVFYDITTETIREQELIEKQKQLHSKNTNLQEQLVRDALTGCLNKNYYDYFMSEEQLYWAKQDNYSMLLIDVDDFKTINDTQGHLVGDETLRQFGSFLRSFFRKTDKIIRYGGDEFVVFLPQADKETAQRITENLLQAMKKRSDLEVSVSIGVSSLRNEDTASTWFERADQALYQVKAKGKGSFRYSDGEKFQEVEVFEG